MEPLEVLTLIIAGSTAVIMTVALAAYARRRHLDRRPRVVNSVAKFDYECRACLSPIRSGDPIYRARLVWDPLEIEVEWAWVCSYCARNADHSEIETFPT